MSSNNLKILVFGAGAVGAYFGGRLAQAGAEVSVVCRSDYDSVKESGYRIKSIEGDFQFMPVQVCRSAADYQGDADIVMVTTKVLPGTNVPELIRPAVSANASIFIIQNGIDVEKDFAEAFPGAEIISSIAYIGVARAGNGYINHEGAGRLHAGMYPEGKPSPRLEQLAKLFEKAGVDCKVVDDIVLSRWIKLVWNVPFNPVSVLAGCVNTQEMAQNPELEQLCSNLMVEVCEVAKACGKELPLDMVEKNLNYTRNFPPYKTSMLLDYENRRPLEVEAILGNVIRNAETNNVPIPHIRTIYALLLSVDRKLMRGKEA
ncbi:MAG: ketopantoate reductase family protein [Victivallaceae bacterium]